jgi:hypothetical protein
LVAGWVRRFVGGDPFLSGLAAIEPRFDGRAEVAALGDRGYLGRDVLTADRVERRASSRGRR